jgi:hypothetical protein
MWAVRAIPAIMRAMATAVRVTWVITAIIAAIITTATTIIAVAAAASIMGMGAVGSTAEPLLQDMEAGDSVVGATLEVALLAVAVAAMVVAVGEAAAGGGDTDASEVSDLSRQGARRGGKKWPRPNQPFRQGRFERKLYKYGD